MGQIFDRISRLARAYVNDASSPDQAWAEQMLGSDDDELRRLIDELNTEPRTSDVPDDVRRAFSILGIAPTRDLDVIKRTYRTAITQWHPDRFVNASPADQQRALERSREINAAYLLLKAYYDKR